MRRRVARCRVCRNHTTTEERVGNYNSFTRAPCAWRYVPDVNFCRMPRLIMRAQCVEDMPRAHLACVTVYSQMEVRYAPDGATINDADERLVDRQAWTSRMIDVPIGCQEWPTA